MTPKTVRPYGIWSSPISPFMLSQRTRMGDVAWDSDGETLIWLENRSDRGVLVARTGREATRDLTDDQSVRGGVGYGGGEFAVQNGQVVFADRSGRLFVRTLGFGRPRPITPPFGAAAGPVFSPDGQSVVYVFSDGQEDALAMVNTDGSQWPAKLVQGADFYMQPTWHPHGKQLAWVEWDHPNMPWDGTRLMMAVLDGSPARIVETHLVAGDGKTPAAQPRFSPDGRYLAFLIAAGEWENLVVLDLMSGEQRVIMEGQGAMLSEPAWVQGGHSYGWSADSRRIYSLRYEKGFASLWYVDLEGGQPVKMDTGAYTDLHQLAVSTKDNCLAMLASSSNCPVRVIRVTPDSILVEARSEPESVAPAYFSTVRPITWAASDGEVVYGMFYAPANPDFESPGLPPLIVHVHGGPTLANTAGYYSETAYFTSRGYAWLDVNYRGSTGYGRSYQDSLREHWGAFDVDDVVSGAKAAAALGLVDGERMAIMGGSAGGYTVLNALIQHAGLFKAGICEYGVSNLFTLATDTHKFEARYLDGLVGKLPDAAERYRAWSPIFHVDQIRDPMAVFQGSEDKVVPPSQSEQLVQALRQNGVPHIYKVYEGEGHGFRKSATIEDFLEQVERFLLQYVLFS